MQGLESEEYLLAVTTKIDLTFLSFIFFTCKMGIMDICFIKLWEMHFKHKRACKLME